MLLLSLRFGHPILAWLVLLASVWPYRYAVTVQNESLRIRWLFFSATITVKRFASADLSPSSLGLAQLTIQTLDGPRTVLQGPPAQLAALREGLLVAVGAAEPAETTGT